MECWVEDENLSQGFEMYRRLLVGVAYRVLGSVADAEDVVQETWLRWSATDRSDVRDPRAFLITTTSRLALNALRSRQARRESYIGPWLPEPMFTDSVAPVLCSKAVNSSDPINSILEAESVSFALLVVLESLTPLERVVFVLHDLFGFQYEEVAAALERSEPAIRQLASRARRHVREHRRSTLLDPVKHLNVTQAFMHAAVDGDVSALLGVLAPDVIVLTDGGGRAKAALRPIHGAVKAARFLAAISGDAAGITWELSSLNGQTGVLLHRGDQLIGTVDLDTADGQVNTLRVQLNPAKLTGIQSGPHTQTNTQLQWAQHKRGNGTVERETIRMAYNCTEKDC